MQLTINLHINLQVRSSILSANFAAPFAFHCTWAFTVMILWMMWLLLLKPSSWVSPVHWDCIGYSRMAVNKGLLCENGNLNLTHKMLLRWWIGEPVAKSSALPALVHKRHDDVSRLVAFYCQLYSHNDPTSPGSCVLPTTALASSGSTKCNEIFISQCSPSFSWHASMSSAELDRGSRASPTRPG